MDQKKLKNSPIIYYINRNNSSEWVLFLHAAFVDHRMFNDQINYFKNKYNLLAVDIIGHGRSIEVKKGDSIDKMSFWIDKILRTENISKINIVGISLGAVLAQDFANLYQEKVSSLACFGGYDINNFDKDMQKENSFSQMLMMLKAFFSIRCFARSNKKISAYSVEAQNKFYDMNLEFPKRSFVYLASLKKMINKHENEQRKYPLLIGCGEHDIEAELLAVQKWKDSDPYCKMVIFKDAGHCVNMDVPDKFNAVMEDFWEETKP